MDPAFAKWLKKWRPSLYAAAMSATSSPSLGAIDDDTGEWSPLGAAISDWVDSLKSIADRLLPTVYEKKVLEAQLQRVRQGLPPAPTAAVQHQAAIATRAAGHPVPPALAGLFSAKGLVLAGLAIGGFLLFGRRVRQHRRGY